MERIKLEKGLIALGSRKGDGKTRFALKLANHIAQKENVLFISYTDYKEKLIAIIEEIDGSLNKNLNINTDFGYFGEEVFLRMIKFIKAKNISTVFLDDIDNFCGIGTNDYHQHTDDKYGIIEDLKYLSELLNIKLVFMTNTTESRFEDINFRPNLRNFRWSRSIINDCSQIFDIFRPSRVGLTEDENGKSIIDNIELSCLKNKENKEEILTFNNKEINIYKRTYSQQQQIK